MMRRKVCRMPLSLFPVGGNGAGYEYRAGFYTSLITPIR
jgi:hypothetical protein